MIESVLQQDYPNFELIIVNDGSTDNSSKIIANYAESDKRIILINQANSGKPSIARNHGLKNSTGEYICYLDADDSFMPDKLSKVMNGFKENPDFDFIFHDYSQTDENLSIIENSFLHKHISTERFNHIFNINSKDCRTPKVSLYKFSLFQTPLLWTGSIAFKKASYPVNNILFDESLSCAEDILMWNYLITQGQGAYIDEPLACYRDSPNSITKNIAQLDLDNYHYYQMNIDAPLEALSQEENTTLLQMAEDNLLSAAYGFLDKKAYKKALQLNLKAISANFSIKNVVLLCKSLLKTLFRK